MSSHILLALLACVAVAAAGNPLLYKQFPSDVIPEIQPRQNVGINYRLPNNTVPESYNVQFTTNVHQGDRAFTGSVDITINIISLTSSIVLHHRQLTIGTIGLTNANGAAVVPLAPAPYPYDSTTDFLTINLATGTAPLPVGGRYILRIPFSGQLRTDEAGFYLSTYVAADNSIRSLATTQFESTDARHGFPCYDEPALRARFTISITHHSTYSAISNMPGTTLPQPNSMVTTTFEPTPPTPTYLLAYVVSDFASRGNTATPTAFQQKVYARPNAIQGADFGLQAGIDILTAFENYFGNKFPLPKMDQVAVPDFAAGAMENWGLVTYREQYILFFAATSTYVDRYNIVTIIAHEYAHQWFGNLVTPKWWTYLWLNEGFATLFEFYATHWVFPEWSILDTFVLTSQNVMQSDASPNTRPMTHYVESPDDVSRLFDNVAYPKSGSVLRMFLHAFSEASFKKGLVNYQNKMAYLDATEEDLIEGIQTAVTEDNTLPATMTVSNIMLSWTRQAGFPVVNVVRDYTSGAITLEQERYFTVKPAVQSTSLWWIPYNFASASSSVYTTFADRWIQGQRSTVVSNAAIPAEDWLIINNEQTGFYRVQYDNQNYKLIANELTTGNFSKFKITTRSSIISDVFDFAYTERLNYTVVFDIISYLEHELDNVPWATAFTGLNNVDRLFAGSSKYADFTSFIRKLLTHVYSTTGVLDVEAETHFKKQTRISAMNWACRLGLESCLRDANTLLKEHLATGTNIHQNNLQTVYCNGIRSSSTEDYLAFGLKLRGQANSAERLRIISALTCKRDSITMASLLQTSISAVGATFDFAYVSSAERTRVFNDIAANGQIGAAEAIKFLINNLDNANTHYTTNGLNSALVNLARFVVSDELRVEYNLLLTAASATTYITPNTIASANANLAANQRWIDRNRVDIENWLESGASSFTVPSMIIAVLLVVSRLF